MSIIGGPVRKRILLQLATLVLLAGGVSLVLATAAAGQGEQLAYSRSVAATFEYGSEPTQLGRRVGPERRPIGPVSFAVDAAGRLAIADDVNGRVQVYSPAGQLARSLPARGWIHDLVFDKAGDLYTLDVDGVVASHDVETGQTKWRGSLTAGLARTLGLFGVVGETVDLRSPDQASQPLVQAGKPVPIAEQAAKRKGAKSPSGAYYTTSYRDRGHVYRLDGQGTIVRDISLGLSDVASVVFLAEDRAGNVYVQVERFISRDAANHKVGVEVRRFDSRGNLTATIALAPVTYVEMSRSTVVTDDGTVYQLLPTESGVSLLRWQSS